GTIWNNFGTPTIATGRLLTDAASNRIRFLPNAGFAGTSNFVYRAWDRTIGINGGLGDATVRGGTTPFSVPPAQGLILVNPATAEPAVASRQSGSRLGSRTALGLQPIFWIVDLDEVRLRLAHQWARRK